MIAAAEPRHAMARAPAAPEQRSESVDDDAQGGETVFAPMSTDELSRLRTRVLPFQAPGPDRNAAPPRGPGSEIGTVSEYVELMLGLAATPDPEALLRRHGLTRESWTATSRTWSDRIRSDPALGRAYDELVARWRR
jgi:hypothetical protein